MQFRWICLFILDSKKSFQMYTHVLSYEVKMVEILTDLNWK